MTVVFLEMLCGRCRGPKNRNALEPTKDCQGLRKMPKGRLTLRKLQDLVQGLLSCSRSSIGSSVDHGWVDMAVSFGLLITRGSIPRSTAYVPIEYEIL